MCFGSKFTVSLILLAMFFAIHTPCVLAQQQKSIEYPYIAEVIGNNVNIRSGPGTNNYRCGQLDEGENVTVVSEIHGWSQIVPPAETFSWISKQYVNPRADNANIGVVTGDSVRVYAGSDYIRPIYSTSVQVQLNAGEEVTLLGEETDDYYKIVPPEGAYLWVSSQYLDYQRPLDPKPQQQAQPQTQAYQMPDTDIQAQQPEVKPAEEPAPQEQVEEPQHRQTEKTEQAGPLLKKYRTLEEKVKQQRKKPLAEQDYADIKAQLQEIALAENAGTVGKYAEFTLKRIERIELAREVLNQIDRQQQQLAKTLENIEEDKKQKLQNIPDVAKYAVVGRFERSYIYQRRPEASYYRVVDAGGSTICYAIPYGMAAEENLDKYLGDRVGLMGQIEPHPESGQALVRFTEINSL